MSKMNLLPQEYVKQRLQYRVDMLCVLLFGLVMVTIMTAEAISSRKVHEVQMTHAKLDARYREVAQFVNDFFVLQTDKRKLFKDAAIIAEMTDRVPRSFLLAMITNNCPKEVTLTRILIVEETIREPVDEDARKKARRKSDTSDKEKKEEIKPPKVQLRIELKGLTPNIDLVGVMMQKYHVLSNPLVEQSELKNTRKTKTSEGQVNEFEISIMLKEMGEVLTVIQQPDMMQQLVQYEQFATELIKFDGNEVVIENASTNPETQP